MLIQVENRKVTLTEDSQTHSFGETIIWFKGYFFIKDQYYTDTKASKYLYDNYIKYRSLEFIKCCNGVFTVVIINKLTDTIVIGNDRFGFGQLFYNKCNNRLVIGDDFWMVKNNTINPKVNKQALYEILRMRYVLGGHTVVNSIEEVLPASLYSINFADKIILERIEYWKFNYSPEQISEKEAEIRVQETLNSIIKKYKNSFLKDSEIGLNLTGGIDSRYLLSLILENGISSEQISTFTFGTLLCDDIKITKQLANICDTNHHNEIFNFPFYDFLKTETINTLIDKIGFSCYYLQGFGLSKLLPKYTNVDVLLTGADGFFVGLMANKKLFSIKQKEDLVDYILQNNASILGIDDISKISSFDISNEELLKSSINKAIPNDSNDFISFFLDWTLKNRLRKYILSIHEMLDSKSTIVYPFYDYDFIDLMSQLPYNSLIGQKAYVNAMFKYSYVNNLKKLSSIRLEKRTIKECNGDFYMNVINRNIIQKILKHIFGIVDKSETYPVYRTFRKSKSRFNSTINNLILSESSIFYKKEILKLIKEHKRDEHFFKYGLPSILTAFRIDEFINTKQSTNN